jgi:DNA-binding NtrC family response regulator
MDRVLVVEDSDSLRETLALVLSAHGYSIEVAKSAEEALPLIRTQNFQCILADFKLPEKNGIELLKETRELRATTPFLLMTAYGSIHIAVDAMKCGANDFLCKPFEPELLCSVVADLIKHRRIVDRGSGLRGRRERKFVSESPQVDQLLQQARKVARVESSALLLGESGTGKELLARYIHENSPRSAEPFVAVNCAAMPLELLESEFFGHEAGAFTGATQTRVGVLEMASSGTLFLDEVGDMPSVLQVKLLRALQEREIRRLGGNKLIKVSPRLIAATNRDIRELLETGLMREDFYYRVAVVTLHIPALRERACDIDLLSDYYLRYFCEQIGRETLQIDTAARNILQQYAWPGNARELENVIERAVVLAEKQISPEHLGLALAPAGVELSLTELASAAARQAEITAILNALRATSGNKSRAASLLGVSYKTLLNKVRDYGLGAPQGPESDHTKAASH